MLAFLFVLLFCVPSLFIALFSLAHHVEMVGRPEFDCEAPAQAPREAGFQAFPTVRLAAIGPKRRSAGASKTLQISRLIIGAPSEAPTQAFLALTHEASEANTAPTRKAPAVTVKADATTILANTDTDENLIPEAFRTGKRKGFAPTRRARFIN
jgi:hypothetical protein